MVDKLLDDIAAYIEFLQGEGLYITVHGEINEYIYKLSEYNLHNNPFCVLVKSDDDAWQRCISSQCKIFAKENREPFWGMCHAGIEEYIFPVWDEKSMFAFVSVSGYAVNREEALMRINAVSNKYILDKHELVNIYNNKLFHIKPDLDYLRRVINPLCHMLLFLHLLKPSEISAHYNDNNIYNMALVFIKRNFAKSISLSDVADFCSCSVSSVCHLFRKYNGMTVKEYIVCMRMQNAENLLRNSRLSISCIADLSGFTDSDYFSTVFKKRHGLTPTKFRQSYN